MIAPFNRLRLEIGGSLGWAATAQPCASCQTNTHTGTADGGPQCPTCHERQLTAAIVAASKLREVSDER
jgi:hypothetical protein